MRVLRLMSICWSLALVCAGCLREAAAPVALVSPPSNPIGERVLPSGLKVVTERAPDFGVSAVVLVVGSGSAAEVAGQEGLAHLTEHLVFKARHDGAANVWQRLSEIGAGTFNGTTSWDHTTYYAVVPTTSLEATLRLYTDMLAQPLAGVDEAEFAHERKVVRNELRLRDENGRAGQAISWLAEHAFEPPHPYAHPISGTHASLDGLKLEHAKDFVKQHYVPSNATLVISAPLAEAELIKLLDRISARHPSLSSPGKRLPAVGGDLRALEVPAKDMQRLDAPIPNPTLWLGWSMPASTTALGDPLPLLTKLIDGAFWSNLRSRHPDIVNLDAGFAAGARASLFYVEVTLDKADDAQAVKESVVHHIQQGIAERVNDPPWFTLYRDHAATSAIYALEDVGTRAIELSWAAHFSGDPKFLLEQPLRVAALSGDAVFDYYRRFLTEERAHAVLLKPSGASLPAEALTGLGTASSPGERAPASTPIPNRATLREWMNGLENTQVVRSELKNGLQILIVPRPRSAYHTVLLGFHGGRAAGPPGAATAALWASYNWSLPASSAGIFHAESNGADHSAIIMRATGNRLSTTLATLKEKLKFQLYWPPVTFTSQVETWERQEQSPAGQLANDIRRAVFGDHVYGASPTSRQIRALSATDVHGYTQLVRRPENGALIIVGDIDPEYAIAAAEQEIGDWTAATRGQAVPAPAALDTLRSPAERVFIRDWPGSGQSRLEFLCLLPVVSREQRAFGHDVFATWFSERFRYLLREDAAASYSFGKSLQLLRGGTAVLYASADLDNANLRAALEPLREFIDGTAPLLDATALNRTRASLARLYNVGYSTTPSLAAWVFDAWNRDQRQSSFRSIPNGVLQTNLSTVERIGQHCRDNSVVGLLGNGAALRKAWTEAALSEPPAK